MKKQISLLLLISFMIFAFTPGSVTDKSPLPGKWKCVADNVPDVYRSSTIVISLNEGKLEGKVLFEGGVEVKLNYVKEVGKDVTMSVYVEGCNDTKN